MSKRVLVTGGAGFLGSHLCTVLLDQGREVLCIDNFFTGARGNVDELLDHRKFEILRHDATLPLYVEVDEVDNLALPGISDPLPARSGAHHQNQCHGGHQCPWAGQAPPRKERLNWHPRVPLKTGLERTIAYLERLLATKQASEQVLVGKAA